ncbi:MAG TPA: lytic transglycosylase domain-containing protein [Candidatus Eisenbacteria bacterium]|nr:lytic transglycosylase domain-containing protein [Candidatus Eisenbacteria bacterium]
MRRSSTRKWLQLAWSILFAGSWLQAAEMANLRNGFSIRHEYHEDLGPSTRLYLSRDPSGGYVEVATSQIESFEPAPPDASSPAAQPVVDLTSIIQSASARSRIDADFIASVIRAESGNNARAVSPKGAEGLMQLMPETANSLGVSDSFDPAANVDGGVRYLRELLLRYNGDAVKALAAYNAGPRRVQQYHGVPPYRETHAYVTRVIRDYNRKKTADTRKQAGMRPGSSDHNQAKNATNSGGN